MCGALPVGLARASSPWTPASLGNTLALWLDAQDAATLYTTTAETTLAGNGATVGRWKDKSGNNKHADQATSTKRPTRSDTGILSKRALTFDGGDSLTTPSVLTTGQSVEVYCVARVASGSNNGLVESSVNADSTAGAYRLIALTTQFMARCLGNVGMNGHRTASVDSSAHLFRASFDFAQAANETTLYVDASTGSSRPETANNTGSFSSQVVYLGSRAGTSLFLTGAIGEILVCNQLLSAGNATTLLNYLKTKWGTP